jgi:hypothetical protein
VYGTGGGYYSPKRPVSKVEARRYNSLTLNCSERTASVINGTAAGAFKDSVVIKKDDNGNKDGYHNDADDERRRIDDSSHKDGNLAAITIPSSEQSQGQGNQTLFYGV